MRTSTINKQKSTAITEPDFGILDFNQLNWSKEASLPDQVSIFDLQELRAGKGLTSLKSALENNLPFYIKNFGIPESEVESVFNITRHFFNQPEKEKAKMAHPELPLILRGYSAYGAGAYENSLNGGKAINQYTKYAWGPIKNVAPNTEFSDAYKKMQLKLSEISDQVLDCIGEALDLKSHDQWQNLFQGEDTVLHCQCYYPEKPLGKARMVTHADASSVTLLTQLPSENGHVGLKVESGDGYIGVPAIRGTIVIMVGETMNSLSNGRIKPVMHAVTGPTENIETSERSSMPFFANPRDAFKMKPPPQSTHSKFYNADNETTFRQYSDNIAAAYAKTEKAG